MLAIHGGAQAGAEEAVPQHAHGDDHADHIDRRSAAIGMHHGAEEEEKQKGERVVENQHHAIAPGQLEIDNDVGPESLHSRSLFPVSSMNTSSSVGRFR